MLLRCNIQFLWAEKRLKTCCRKVELAGLTATNTRPHELDWTVAHHCRQPCDEFLLLLEADRTCPRRQHQSISTVARNFNNNTVITEKWFPVSSAAARATLRKPKGLGDQSDLFSKLDLIAATRRDYFEKCTKYCHEQAF